MNIVTWNVNGLLHLLAVSKQTLEELLDSLNADVVCMQETKLPKGRLRPDLTFLEKYWAFYHFSAAHIGMYGVATFCRKATATPLTAWLGFNSEEYAGSDQEGRVLITDHGDFALINAYFPTGAGSSQLTYKVWFQHVIQETLERFVRGGREVVLAGDFNFALSENDHYNPQGSNADNGLKVFARHRGRMWLAHMLSSTLELCVDVFRKFHPDDSNSFTYWKDEDHRSRNYGARIDYIIATKLLADTQVTACAVEAETKGSDHCPVRLVTTVQQATIPADPPECCAALTSEYEQDTSQRVLNDYFPVGKPRPLLKQKKKEVNLTPNPDTQDVSTNPGNFLCHHNEPAMITIVKKPGKNQGRPFYMCRRPVGVPKDPEGRCDYFQWGDVNAQGKQCECNMPAKLTPVRARMENTATSSCGRMKRRNGSRLFNCSLLIVSRP